MRDALRMPERKRNGNRAPLRQRKKGEPCESCSIDDCLKVTNPRVQRKFADVPVRKSGAPRIVADERKFTRETQ